MRAFISTESLYVYIIVVHAWNIYASQGRSQDFSKGGS